MKAVSGSAIKYPLRRRSELRHRGHRTIQVHTIGLPVNVCRLATDARVAVNGDFVQVLVNACHVLLFDGLCTSTTTRRTMRHDYCYMLRSKTSSVTPIFAKSNVRNPDQACSTGQAMGLNTNLNRDAEVPSRHEGQGQGTALIYSSVCGTQCLYSNVVYVSIQISASRQAGHRKSQLSD